MYDEVKLSCLPIAELRELRDKVSAAIRRAKAAQRVLPVKYRNPANPAQGWAGRGLPPAWAKGLGKRALKKCLVA